MSALSPFGQKLRAWRKQRGLSQLDLAASAQTTPRYVSFVETGRARPGKDLVLRLGEALQLSLRDKNALLVAAGLRPAFQERPLEHVRLRPIKTVIDHVLDKHNPYPGFAFGPGLRILQVNTAAERLFPGMSELSPEQLVDAWCQTAADTARVINVLRKELDTYPAPNLADLLRAAEAHQDRLGLPSAPDEDPLTGTLFVQDRAINTVATVLRFDAPAEVTVEELRVELVYPADDEADRAFRRFFS